MKENVVSRSTNHTSKFGCFAGELRQHFDPASFRRWLRPVDFFQFNFPSVFGRSKKWGEVLGVDSNLRACDFHDPSPPLIPVLERNFVFAACYPNQGTDFHGIHEANQSLRASNHVDFTVAFLENVCGAEPSRSRLHIGSFNGRCCCEVVEFGG